MATNNANLRMGHEAYLLLSPETAWGSGASTDYYLPVLNYGVDVQEDHVVADTFTGEFEPRRETRARNSLTGQLSAELYPHFVGGQSWAQRLLDWGLARNTSGNFNKRQLRSYRAKWADPHAGKIHAGIRVNQLTLSGQAGGVWTIGLDLVGKEETTDTIAALDPVRKHPRPFLFRDTNFYLDDTPDGSSSPNSSGGDLIQDVRSFSLTVGNSLFTDHQNSLWPTVSIGGKRSVQVQMSIYKESAAYDVLVRGSAEQEYSMTVELIGSHEGTGANTNTVVRLQLERLARISSPTALSMTEPSSITVNFVGLKPDYDARAIDTFFGTN